MGMPKAKEAMQDFERAVKLLAKSDKLDRERVIGRVATRHWDTIIHALRQAAGREGATP